MMKRADEDERKQMHKMVPMELWRLVDWLLQNGLDEVCARLSGIGK